MSSAGSRLTYFIDDFSLSRFLPVAAGFGTGQYGFVVTPNVDHLLRCDEDATFRGYYGDATYVLNDSRVVQRALRITRGLRLPVCPGSDLTAAILTQVVKPDDRIVIVGGSLEQAEMLSRKFGLRDIRHYNPPMGFTAGRAETEACLAFIEQCSPFRFCFLAVGSPQQEMLAYALRLRGAARGLALCIGASLNFLTGVEVRAPRWMQRGGIEWLYRLLRSPGRLGRRYLVRGPRFFFRLRYWTFTLRRQASAG
jgi:exopolysaccharide biosynthesis WecB/TagA/CpsF family protein